MAEVDERIARLERLLDAPAGDCDEAGLRHTLRLLRQLRVEIALAPTG